MWAYDKDDGCNKIFRISRIGNIRIGDAWSSKNLHKKGQMDVFHCTGVKQVEVKLELDMLAHNLLIEEYQDAESEVVKDSNGKWILDTMVWDIHGVGRFYCGLADHITILEGSELIEYAKDFFNSGLKRL
jgi:predicted DNA-binding transcriptional regulator YafY